MKLSFFFGNMLTAMVVKFTGDHMAKARFVIDNEQEHTKLRFFFFGNVDHNGCEIYQWPYGKGEICQKWTGTHQTL